VLAEHVYSQGLAHTHEPDNTITSWAIPLLRASGYEPGDALLALQISSQSVQAISSLDPLIHFSSNPPALRPDSFLAESDKQPLAAPSACQWSSADTREVRKSISPHFQKRQFNSSGLQTLFPRTGLSVLANSGSLSLHPSTSLNSNTFPT